MRRSTPCAPARGAIRTVALLLGWLWVVATVGACGRSGADPQHTSTRPERIVSQVVTSDEILWELGDEVRARVAGVSIMADDPTYSGVANSWPSSVPRVPGTSEALVAARPDLVIVASFTSPETRALLERSGIPTLLLDRFEGFADYRARVRRIAARVGAPRHARRVIERFDARLDEVRFQPIERPGVVSLIGDLVAGRNTTFDDVATAAGYRNLAAEHGIEGHRSVGLEEVVSWNPEFVVVDCPTEPCAEREAEIATIPGLSGTTAGRRAQIVAVPPRFLFSTGIDMLETVRILATRHPEASR